MSTDLPETTRTDAERPGLDTTPASSTAGPTTPPTPAGQAPSRSEQARSEQAWYQDQRAGGERSGDQRAGGEPQRVWPVPAGGAGGPAWPTAGGPDAERTHRVDPRSYTPAGTPGTVPAGQRVPARQLAQTQLGQQTSPTAASGPPSHELSSAQLLRETRPAPQTGWRRGVYVATAGLVNPGEGARDTARRELAARVGQPLRGAYKLALLSLKGGVGKTTVATLLGATLADQRGDRIVAIDANPDRGTLAQRVPLETTATVRHLLRDASRIRTYPDVRAYTSQAASRLEVLASEQDPAVSEAFSEHDYRQAVELLSYFYNCILTDCGTGLMHSAMKGVLDEADALVVVSPTAIDGARSASATLDWLDAHGYGELVARSITVLNAPSRGGGKNLDEQRVAHHFAARTRSVVRLGFDAHIDQGAEIDLDRLSASTQESLLELAAVVADDFPHAMARRGQA